ncbi:hypothetical protein [Anaeromicrobium sp.]|jgi:NitT/TauT family transport system permease protein|uniref:hypothetical protein n=1 Tax=Anaeromicrobium sp. TaxID=1929132 RepID=UPI002ED6AB97
MQAQNQKLYLRPKYLDVLSWVSVIVGEFIVSQVGIGYLIVYGSQVFKLDLVMMSVFILAILAALMYQFVAYIEKKLIKNNRWL